MRKLFFMLLFLGLAGAVRAQGSFTLTNSGSWVTYTQRFTTATFRISAEPYTTNDVWRVASTMGGASVPGWIGQVSNVTLTFSAGSGSSIVLSNSQVAAYNGLTTTGFLAQSIFIMRTQVLNAAFQNFTNEYRRRQ